MSDTGGRGVSIGSKGDGYPCPKDGAIVTLIGDKGAWCPECHTVWRQLDEVPLDDLDALPTVDDPEDPPTHNQHGDAS